MAYSREGELYARNATINSGHRYSDVSRDTLEPALHENPGILPPGQVHFVPRLMSAVTLPAVLPYAMPRTSSSSTSSTSSSSSTTDAYGATSLRPRPLYYFPRLAKYCLKPSIAPILFSVNGVVGPYIIDIINGDVVLDNARDKVFAEHGWRRIEWTLDWPGRLTQLHTRLSTLDPSTQEPITRTALAKEICLLIHELLVNAKRSSASESRSGSRGHSHSHSVPSAGTSPPSPSYARPSNVSLSRSARVSNHSQFLLPHEKKFAWSSIQIERIRIISLNYYRTVWVPVLAFDAPNTNIGRDRNGAQQIG